MAEPITTLTASAIATLAFQKFIESGAGELAKKFSTVAIAKMNTLLKRIWAKLRGKARTEEVKAAIAQTQKITPEQVSQIAAYLHVAMDEDSQFASDIQMLAQEINAGKLVDQSNMVQNNYDQAKGWQTKVEGGTAYIGEIHIQGKTD
ncbi:hypothetical protein [Vacuolonema iberomarrocanum]|uniref:hypothetical protein n=1 Tax=Vacuolonema iberomarrocanum TaxID=3454632 RepID=UPI0019F598F4|nr:hypothetical protein [filamentous cyanobacterium LEGE 07170]